jgi:hypothetical protein
VGAPGPTVSAIDHGADPSGIVDSTSAIQAAIDEVSEAGGGTAHVPTGDYRIDGLLTVRTSGVVVAGDGPALSRLWFTRTEGMSDTNHLQITGSVVEGVEHPLSIDGEPFSHEVHLLDASGLRVGDDVAVGWVITDDFVADHGMTGVWSVFNGTWRPFFRRTVAGVDEATGTVTLDVPLRYRAQVRDGASLRVHTGMLTEVGVAGLAVSTAGDWDAAWSQDRSHAIGMTGVSDAWISDVHSWTSPTGGGHHLMSGGIEIVASKRVTVANTVMEAAQNRGPNGNGYLYEISTSSEVLIRDARGRAGRHNFIQNWDFGTSGCVFLRTRSEEGRALFASWDPVGQLGFSEFHHSLAMANLIDDSSVADGWQGANRHDYSSGAGHAVTQSVFWNTRGGGKLHSWQFGHGYVIGTHDLRVETSLSFFDPLRPRPEGTEPEDWVEGLGAGPTLDPPSLYVDQLARRLGP